MTYAARPMGDYKTYGYAGDPGFLSSLWKGIKRLAPVAASFIPGVGPILGSVLKVAGMAGVGVGAAKLMAPTPPSFPALGFTGPGAGARGPAMPSFVPPGTGAGGRATGPTRGSVMMVDGCCPQGYHPEKSGKPYCVRNRRMNVGNARALRRGMRRVQGFEKLARRTIQFTRRVKMKKRRSS